MAGQVTRPADVVIPLLSSYIGTDWDDVADVIDGIVHDNNCCYRWLDPTTGVDLNEFRDDRVNVLVDANHLITGYTVG